MPILNGVMWDGLTGRNGHSGAPAFYANPDDTGFDENFNKYLVPGIVSNIDETGGYGTSRTFSQALVKEQNGTIIGSVQSSGFFSAVAGYAGKDKVTEIGGVQYGAAVAGTLHRGISATPGGSAHGLIAFGCCLDPTSAGTLGGEIGSFNWAMNPFSHNSAFSGTSDWSDANRWAFPQAGARTHRMRLSHLALQNGLNLNQFWIPFDAAKYPQRADSASSIDFFDDGNANPYYVAGATPAAFDDPRSVPNLSSLKPLNPDGTENIFYTRIFLNWYDEKTPLTSDKQNGLALAGYGRFLNGNALEIKNLKRHPDHVDGRWRRGIVFNNTSADAVIDSYITATPRADGSKASALIGIDLRNVDFSFGSIRAEGFGIDNQNNAILKTVNVPDGVLGGEITLGLTKSVDPALPESATNARSMPVVYPKLRSKSGSFVVSFSANQHYVIRPNMANHIGSFASI